MDAVRAMTGGVTPGRVLRVFETALGARIGVAICYDREFPMLVRAQAEAGAHLILIPSCTERVSRLSSCAVCCRAGRSKARSQTAMSADGRQSPVDAGCDRSEGAGGIYVPPDAGLSMNGILAAGELNEPGLGCQLTADFSTRWTDCAPRRDAQTPSIGLSQPGSRTAGWGGPKWFH